MKFLGGCLKVLAIIILLLATVICSIVIYTEGIESGYDEAIWVMSAVWVGVLFLFFFFWGVGTALIQVAKLKKKVQALEDRVQTLSAMPRPVAPVAPAAPVVAVAADAPVADTAAPAAPVAPAEIPTDVYTAPVAQAEPSVAGAKDAKKWLPIAIIAAVVVVLVLVLVLVLGGKDKPAANQPSKNPDVVHQDDVPATVGSPEQPEPIAEGIPVQCGDVIEHSDFVMTLDYVEIVDEFKYRTSDISSTSLYVEPGYKLLMLRGVFSNQGTSTIQESSFARSAVINGDYVLEDFDVRMDFLRSSSFEIDPYTEMEYVIYMNIPEKLAEMFQTVTLNFGFNEDLSTPVTNWDMDGNKSTPTDILYTFSGGVGADGTLEAPTEPAPIGISIGDTITCNDYEFTLTDVEFTYELLPPNTSSAYVSYPAESGKVYVHVAADVKNTMQRDLRVEELFGTTVVYNGQYRYTGFPLVNDGDNRFDWVGSYVAATPLELCKAHGLVECPVEVDESGNSVTVLLDIGGTIYEYILR